MSFEVVSIDRPDISWAAIESLAILKSKTWPEYIPSVEDQLKTLLDSQRNYDPEVDAIHYFVFDKKDSVIAHSSSFRRTMFTPQGEVDVMALGAVCVSLNMRGKGLGAAVVKAAFRRVDKKTFPVGVYQTQQVSFYEKLGAKVCENNTWVDSQNKSDPSNHPWQAGETIMHYPASYDWPTGEIDINGGKY